MIDGERRDFPAPAENFAPCWRFFTLFGLQLRMVVMSRHSLRGSWHNFSFNCTVEYMAVTLCTASSSPVAKTMVEADGDSGRRAMGEVVQGGESELVVASLQQFGGRAILASRTGREHREENGRLTYSSALRRAGVARSTNRWIRFLGIQSRCPFCLSSIFFELVSS